VQSAKYYTLHLALCICRVIRLGLGLILYFAYLRMVFTVSFIYGIRFLSLLKFGKFRNFWQQLMHGKKAKKKGVIRKDAYLNIPSFVSIQKNRTYPDSLKEFLSQEIQHF
jgi:hypothetical protein